MSQRFLNTLRDHLCYRLVRKRVNKNGPELTAMMCDPLASKLFDLVCGPEKEALRPMIRKIVGHAGGTRAPTQIKVLRAHLGLVVALSAM